MLISALWVTSIILSFIHIAVCFWVERTEHGGVNPWAGLGAVMAIVWILVSAAMVIWQWI